MNMIEYDMEQKWALNKPCWAYTGERWKMKKCWKQSAKIYE